MNQILNITNGNITLNPAFIEVNFFKIFHTSNYNYNLILELLEIVKDLKPTETITILKTHHLNQDLLKALKEGGLI